MTGGYFKFGTRKELEPAELATEDMRLFQEGLKAMRERGSRIGQVWELRKQLGGGKSKTQIPSAIADPDTGELQVTVESIKDATIRHVISTLKDGVPLPRWKHVVEERDKRHLEYMDEDKEGRTTIQKTAFKTVLKKMKSSGKPCYKDITNASSELHEAFYKYFCLLTDREAIPPSFNVTSLTQLFKKGDPTSLSNWRFIHTKEAKVRLFEGSLTELCKPKILDSLSPYQIGGVEGCRPDMDLLAMKTVLRNREYKRLTTWVSLFDLRKYFDVQSAVDSCDALHQAGITGPLYRLIFLICAKNTLTAKTPIGVTRPFRLGPVVGQGSSLGALQSALNLDKCIFRAFSAKLGIVMTDLGVPMMPLAFQDDLSKLSGSREECQDSHDIVYETLTSKTLELNTKKCKVLICGSSNEAKKERLVYNDYPVFTGPDPTELADQESYLGDEVHFLNCRSSALSTIKKRSGKLRAAAAEAIGLARDFRSYSIGAVAAGLDI